MYFRLLCVVILTALAAGGQNKKPPYKAPRTPDGQPNISGYWSNSTITPFERPAEFGAKEWFTEKELTDFRNRPPAANNDPHYDMSQYGLDVSNQAIAKNLRTSWITGPEGRLPPMTEAARKRVADAARDRAAHTFDGYEYRSSSERCLWWQSEGPPMTPFPGAYNANMEIRQGPGYVVIVEEMIHDARVIPLDNRPHLPSTIRQWFGDSRARWEGETLVVETTNFGNKTAFRGATDALKVTERFTRTDAETILYQFTVEDPNTWTRPWQGESPMMRFPGPIYEYACHEGNMGIINILNGARKDGK